VFGFSRGFIQAFGLARVLVRLHVSRRKAIPAVE
jgi:hypothetical protein